MKGVALVTGASGGIGGAIALQLARDGYAVAVHCHRNEQKAQVVCDEISKTPVGAISNWIDMDGWSFLLRKDGETQATVRSFEEAYAEIEQNVKMAEVERLYKAWIKRLKADTYIKIH